MRMTVLIFITVLIGIGTSYFILPNTFNDHIDLLINISLTVTIFLVGIGIGQNKHLFKDLKKAGLKILVLPIGTIIGSLIGGLLSGLILRQTFNISLAIASGVGWYSISAGLLLPVAGAEISTIAFIANVLREMMSFLFIPIVVKWISPYCGISIGGATTMDTTLPIIAKSTSQEFVLIAFIHGGILSVLVPFLVEFFAHI